MRINNAFDRISGLIRGVGVKDSVTRQRAIVCFLAGWLLFSGTLGVFGLYRAGFPAAVLFLFLAVFIVGALIFFALIVRLFEARRRLEADRHDRDENYWRRVFDSVNIGIILIDQETSRVVDINNRIISLFGVTREEIVGHECYQFVCSGTEDSCPMRGMHQFRNNSEQMIINVNGQVLNILKTAVQVEIGGRKILLESFIDITERKKVEVALQRVRDNLDRIMEAVPDPIFVKDEEHRWVLFNKAFCTFMGRSAEEIAGKNDLDYFPQEQAAVFWQKDEEVFRTEQESINEELFTDAHGDTKTIATRKAFYKDQTGKKFIVGVIRDLTQLKAAQEKLKQSAAEWSRTFDSITDLICITDENLRVVRANKSVCEGLKLDQKDLAGKICCDLMHGNSHRDEQCPFEQMLLDLKPHTVEVSALGGAPYVVTISPILEDGKLIGTVHVSRDISERKVFEEKLLKAFEDLRNARDQLVRTEKLAAIGQLAAGVAHEINNPIGFIASNLEVLSGYVTAYLRGLNMTDQLLDAVARRSEVEISVISEQLRAFEENAGLEYMRNDVVDLLAQSQDGIDRIKNIVADLRTFARDDDNLPDDLVRIETVIDRALDLSQNAFQHRIAVHKHYADTPLVFCNAQKMGQVFVNLIMNARQAIHDRGTIEIRSSRRDGWVRVEISDTGVGIPKDCIMKVFDPFFTTKPVGQGTGLGLSISLEIVRKQGGDIFVMSEPGHGATFIVELPLRKNDS